MCCSWCDKAATKRKHLPAMLAPPELTCSCTRICEPCKGSHSGVCGKPAAGYLIDTSWGTHVMCGPCALAAVEYEEYYRSFIAYNHRELAGIGARELAENRAKSKTGTEVATGPEKRQNGASGASTGPSAGATTGPVCAHCCRTWPHDHEEVE